MREIRPGHEYALENVGGGSQRLSFVQRRDYAGELLPLEKQTPGVLTQEVLRVLINRTTYLQNEEPCTEDTEIILLLRRALVLYESRAARKRIERLTKPERADVCPDCHHILCNHDR